MKLQVRSRGWLYDDGDNDDDEDTNLRRKLLSHDNVISFRNDIRHEIKWI